VRVVAELGEFADELGERLLNEVGGVGLAQAGAAGTGRLPGSVAQSYATGTHASMEFTDAVTAPPIPRE
jgi:hypothetical protein